jgi:hypothetical protein
MQVACAAWDPSLFPATCAFHDRCPDATNFTKSSAAGCPFAADTYSQFFQCEEPGQDQGVLFAVVDGLTSDKFACKEEPTRALMLKYAADEKAFFAQYRPSFLQLQKLGYNPNAMTKVDPCPTDPVTGYTLGDSNLCPALTLKVGPLSLSVKVSLLGR